MIKLVSGEELISERKHLKVLEEKDLGGIHLMIFKGFDGRIKIGIENAFGVSAIVEVKQ